MSSTTVIIPGSEYTGPEVVDPGIIRKIEWTVTKDTLILEPKQVQDAGIQGEHNATLVRFRLPEEFGSHLPSSENNVNITVTLEHVTAYGEYDESEPLNVNSSGLLAEYPYWVEYRLPEAWTQHGGEATLRLVLSRENEAGEKMVAFTAEGRVRYKKREGLLKKVSSVIEQSIRALLELCYRTADKAESAEALATDAAASAASDARTASTAAGQAKADAQTATAAAATATEGADTVSKLAPQVEGDAEAATNAAGDAITHANYAATAAQDAQGSAAAAEAAAEKAETKVESLLERNKKLPVSLWVGTQAEYDAITDKDETRLYLISDDKELDGVTNFVANAADLNGNGMAFDSTVTLTDPERISALFKHKMALVRAAGQTVLCSVQTATITSAATSDNIIHISGCASNTYANPVTVAQSYAINPISLIVVDIRIEFPSSLSPDATDAIITNYSRRQTFGSNTVEGVNVWRIDLLNATKY